MNRSRILNDNVFKALHWLQRGFKPIVVFSVRKNTNYCIQAPKKNVMVALTAAMTTMYGVAQAQTSSFIVSASESDVNVTVVEKIDEVTEKRVITEADILYSQHETDALYDFLQTYRNVNSAELSWRLARAACDKAKHCPTKSKEREILMYEAFRHAERGVQTGTICGSCHRWYAVMLNYVGDYEGIKQKIKNSYVVKEHFLNAIELNPKDATSMFCLGQWCYYFAEMSWYTAKIAALIFGTPPSSTFEEAFEYFNRAEKTDPNFYSMNHLMLGRTLLKLNEKSKAMEHLVKARDLPVKSPDDQQAHDEAVELLSQLSK